MYWLCLELIAETVDRNNVTFELEHDAELLGYRLKIDSKRVEEIMKYMINLGLFEYNQAVQRITCLKLAMRLENSIVKSKELLVIQGKIREDMYTNPGLSGNSSEHCGQIRIDKNRIDKKREEEGDKPPKRTHFKPPTPREVKEYAQSIQFNLNPDYFCDFYTSRNWMAGKVKMKDWKAAVRTWKMRDKEFNGNKTSAPLRPEVKRIPDPKCKCGSSEYVFSVDMAKCSNCGQLFEREGDVWREEQ